MKSTEIRDIRPSAAEIKFLVDRDLGARIRERARAILSPDPHASGPVADEYRTTTIYFDTDSFAVYQRRGSFRRSKYRIRRYGQGNIVFLERKLRTPDVLSKRRSTVLIEAISRLASDTLDPAWAGQWFHERILMRRLMPVCQVSYLRTARVGMTDNGPMRLTLDDELLGLRVDAPEFQAAGQQALLTDRTIVEMKFTGPMPAVFRSVVEEFKIEPVRVSKYRLGVEATRPIVTEPESTDEGAATNA